MDKKLPDDDWSDWISALIVNLPLHDPNLVEGSQTINRAKQLLVALDQGGIPTDPIRVNNIARALGLEVDASAPMEETIARIRLLLD